MAIREAAIAACRKISPIGGTLGQFVDAAVDATDERFAAAEAREAEWIVDMEARETKRAAEFADLMRKHEEVMRLVAEHHKSMALREGTKLSG